MTSLASGAGIDLSGTTGSVTIAIDPAGVITQVTGGAGITVTQPAPGVAQVALDPTQTVMGIQADGGATLRGTVNLTAGPGVTISNPSGSDPQISAPASGVQTVNGLGPNASGNFSVAAGSNVSVTPNATNDGVVISATGGGGGLDLATADARYVNASGDSMGGLSVTGLSSSGQFHFVGSGSAVVRARTSGGSDTPLELRANPVQVMSGSGGSTSFVVNGSASFSSLSVSGPKQFVVDYPGQPDKEIVYCSLEGPECALYARGSARLSKGRAVVQLPDHFKVLAIRSTITAQVTPTADCQGLFVAKKAPGRIVVKELGGGKSDASFDYMVYAKRLGTQSHTPVRQKQN